MKAWLVLTPAVMLLVALVAAAFVLDAVRAGRRRTAELNQVDADLAKQEARLLTTLENFAELPAVVAQARDQYRAASDRDTRQTRYAELAREVEVWVLPNLSSDRPGERRSLDDLAGALNRRRTVARRWGELVDEYDAWRETLPGRLAARWDATRGGSLGEP